MASKRGPKTKPRAQKMLALFEYEWVRSRSSLNETQLDIEYARADDGSRLSAGEIRCVFRHARIREKPFPEDVLFRLDADPVMTGIGAYAHSVFWRLLENPPVSRDQTRDLVKQALERLGCGRPVTSETKSAESGEFRSEKSALAGAEDETEWARKQVELLIAENPYSLDLIALLGALCREAWFCFRAEEAAYFGTKFWILLQDFLSQRGMERLDGLLDEFAVDRIIYWRDESKCGSAWLPHGDEILPDSTPEILG